MCIKLAVSILYELVTALKSSNTVNDENTFRIVSKWKLCCSLAHFTCSSDSLYLYIKVIAYFKEAFSYIV